MDTENKALLNKSNENQPLYIEGLDVSDVVDTKVSQTDLVELLVERQKDKHIKELSHVEAELHKLKGEHEVIEDQWKQAMNDLFTDAEKKKIKEIHSMFGKGINIDNTTEIVGYAWDPYHPQHHKRGDHYYYRHTSRYYHESMRYTDYQADRYTGDIKEGYGGTMRNVAESYGNEINFKKMYIRKKFRVWQEENKTKLKATNIQFEFAMKKRAPEEIFKPIFDASMAIVAKEIPLASRKSFLECTIEAIESNRSKFKAHVTEQLLNSSQVGSQLLSRLEERADLLPGSMSQKQIGPAE